MFCSTQHTTHNINNMKESTEKTLKDMQSYKFDEPIVLIIEGIDKDEQRVPSNEDSILECFLNVKCTAMSENCLDNLINDSKKDDQNRRNNQNTQTTITDKNISKANVNASLKTITDNILKLLNLYECFVTETTSKHVAFKQTELCLASYKQYYYEFSFKIINEVILPRENDKAFIEEFLKNTFKTVSNKLNIKITYDFVCKLFYDMVKWSIAQKCQIDIILDSHRSKQVKEINNNVTEINANAPSEFLSKLTYMAQQAGNEINKNCVVRKAKPRKRMKKIKAPKENNVEHSYDYNYGFSQNQIDFGRVSNNTSDINNLQFNTYPNREGYRNACNSYTDTCNEYTNTCNDYTSPNMMSMSPVPCMDHCNGQYEQEMSTPVISYVTSINPNVRHIAKGYCVLCGDVTNTMCIGCYKIYYCSVICQNMHWPQHKYFCRR